MKTITKREFEIIALYSKGLTFKEMGSCLNIATRTAINYYMRAKEKGKTPITKAKRSRYTNKSLYKTKLNEVVNITKKLNNDMKRYTTSDKQVSIKQQSQLFRINYIDDCLVFAYKSYYENRLKKAKKLKRKVNS